MAAGALITDKAADFRSALPGGGALMALDVGTKTIGTAFCDPGWSFASAGKTLPRGKFAADRVKLEALIGERGTRGIVIGLPLNMDGSEGPRIQATRAFVRNMERLTPLPFAFWDERLSTVAAERSLLEMDVSRAKRKQRIDSAAAAFILQGVLDRLQVLGNASGSGAAAG